jgi:hypothetical protein
MQTFTGLDYLRMDIASNFGLDKLDWDKRLEWTTQHEGCLEDMLPKAETPALYYAAVQAYRATQRGEPTGYPISLDAASSGLQLLAVLIGCEASAKLCGVVSTGHREDAYTVIYQAMCGKLNQEDDTIAGGITRADCKQAIMTALYGSTAVPKRVFGETEQLAVFFKTMESLAPGAWDLNQALQALWQPGALSHDWVLPDNFHVHVPVMTAVTKTVQFQNKPVKVTVKENLGTKEGRSLGPNIVHSIDGMIVREIHARCDYDKDMVEKVYAMLLAGPKGKQCFMVEERDHLVKKLWDHYLASGFLSARILSYLSPQNLHLVDKSKIVDLVCSLPELPFKVMSIHDCFRVHPNYGNDIRRQYNQVLSEIAGSNLLSYIASQIVGYTLPANKLGDISAKILEADYALC